MAKIRSVHPIQMGNYPAPSFRTLARHADRHGISERRDYRGRLKRYKSYRTLAANPFVQVAYDYLTCEEYLRIIELIGYGNFTDQARKDWEKGHKNDSG